MIQTSPKLHTHAPGEIAVLPRVSVHGDVTPPNLDDLCLSSLGLAIRGRGDLANVVPFRRPKTTQSDAPPCVVDPATRPIPHAPASRSRRFSLALAATVLMHGAAFAAFFYQPPPLASIGVEAVSVEIVVGSNSLAGDTDPNSKASANSAYAPPEEKVADTPTIEDAPKAAEKPMELAAAQPEQKIVEHPPKEATNAVVLAPAMPLTTPQPPKPVEARPVETKPVARKPTEAERDAAKKKTLDARKKTQVAAAPAASDPSIAAKGAGIGRSDAVSNYPGIVRAHLMRYLPSVDASYNVSATVRFAVSSSGSLVSASLARSSGNGAADAAVQSMVRRASPFPAPGPGDKRDLQITINLK